ncbi:MAG: alpha/beta fold hydrolase, partial [Thermoleophilia bacterium]|nr:alpha/beta fold hydrolase [Thermoleophilia bacterium]
MDTASNGHRARTGADATTDWLRTGAGIMDVPTGLTPKDVVWTLNKTTLYRYRGPGPARHRVPVLIVYGLINKPYILDLRPENSFVGHLLGEGFDVFLLDWGEAGREDAGLTLDELVCEHLPKAVERMRRAGAGPEYTLFGYCMGGTMAVIHAALRPDGVRNLVALTTPVDFSDPGVFGRWTDPRHLDAEAMASALGIVPGPLIDLANRMIKPVANFVTTPLVMWQRALGGRDMTPWLAMQKWVNDTVPFPGAAFAQWIGSFYQRNELTSGALTMGGDRVDLAEVTAALLVVTAARDHLVPAGMSTPLID